MSDFTAKIAETQDRITRMLEKASKPSGWENVRAGLSGAFGSGGFAKELDTRTSPAADIKRQGTILELLRGMRSDEMSEERLGMDRQRLANDQSQVGLSQRRLDLDTQRLTYDQKQQLLTQAEKAAAERARLGDKRAEAYGKVVTLYKDMLNPGDFLDWHADFANASSTAEDDTPEALMGLGNEIAQRYGAKSTDPKIERYTRNVTSSPIVRDGVADEGEPREEIWNIERQDGHEYMVNSVPRYNPNAAASIEIENADGQVIRVGGATAANREFKLQDAKATAVKAVAQAEELTIDVQNYGDQAIGFTGGTARLIDGVIS